MAKLPDGMVMIFRPYKTEIRIIREELIFCKNCEHFQHETDMCTMWGACTKKEGYCFKADQKEEDIVALDLMTKCDMCGKEIIPGNNENGLPNGVGFELEDGTMLNVCSECICALGDNAEEFDKFLERWKKNES